MQRSYDSFRCHVPALQGGLVSRPLYFPNGDDALSAGPGAEGEEDGELDKRLHPNKEIVGSVSDFPAPGLKGPRGRYHVFDGDAEFP